MFILIAHICAISHVYVLGTTHIYVQITTYIDNIYSRFCTYM